jgi:hypothetical protein
MLTADMRALALAILLVPAAARAQSEDLEVVVARDESALTELIAPEGGRAVVCEGSTCPSGVTRVVAENIRFGAHGARGEASARLRVTAVVPLIGQQQLQSNVTCQGEPRIDDAGVLRVHDVHCDVSDLPALGSVVGGIVARELESRSIDVLAQAREGRLSRHSSDPRLASPCASTCVERVSLITPLETGGHVRIALRIRVRPRAACCPGG